MRHMASRHREFYIPKGATKFTDKVSNAVVYTYTNKSGAPAALAFKPKAFKPSWHYRFRDETRRAQACREFFDRVNARRSMVKDTADKRKAFTHSVQVGDIYRTSWGYDQTNVEFFEVTEVKGKYAVLREIESASEDGGVGSEKCVPQSGAFLSPRYKGDDRGAPIRRLIQERHIKIDNVRTAWPWGTRGPGGIVIGSACHRTASGWGH